MNKKKTSLIILAAALFALWMYFSTAIIAGLYNAPQGVKALSEYPTARDEKPTWCSMADLEIDEGPFRAVRISGLAACYTKFGGESEARVYLCSKNKVYSVPTETLPKGENEATISFDGYEKTMTPFESVFCPLSMSDGYYCVAVSLVEDGEARSVYYTNVYMRKRGEYIVSAGVPAGETEPVSYDVSGAVVYNIDVMEQTEDSLRLTGWAHISGVTHRSPIYDFIIESESSSGELHYSLAHVIERRDAAAALGLGDNIYIGFEASVPQADVKAVRLILQTIDGYAATDAISAA